MRQATIFLLPVLFLLLIASTFGSTSVSFENTTRINNPLPLSASILASPNPVSVGQPVSLLCIAAGGVPPYTYSWTLGDGSTGTGSSLTHTYSAAGDMKVVCKVTDMIGKAATGRTTVTVI